MNLYSHLVGEALSLSQQHRAVLDRLPSTFWVSNLIEFQKWPGFFEPEKAYFRALLKQLSDLSDSEFQSMFGALEGFEARTGCRGITANDPEELQRRLLDHLQRRGQYPQWRVEIDGIFQKLQPLVEQRLYSADREPRLVVILYGEGIAIEREKLWRRFREIGTRVPLELPENATPEAFLRGLFTARLEQASDRTSPTLFEVRQESGNAPPLDNWIIEAGDALHALCERTNANGRGNFATGLSYDRLRSYRERLTNTIYSKVLSGLRSPLELAAYLKTLQVRPQEGVSLYLDDLVLAFIRDVFLAGAGTLIINNTFVEWGAVQAIKRAQPRLLVARFGVRDKLKPFSSLLLFSKPRPADQIPILQDPLGSFVDAEMLAYYIWLNAEKGPPYRGRTLYLLLAEGVDEMLAVTPASRVSPSALPPAKLPDVAVTMAHWMGITLPRSPGRVMAPLVS